jgi:predicted nucleotide-binding protein
MARKKAENELKVSLELLVSADEAKAKLLDRIEKGQQFKVLKINSDKDFDTAQKSYYKWDDFNIELLKRQFTTTELSEEYIGWAGVGSISMYELSLGEKIGDFHKIIDAKVHRIDSIIERIELIPVSNQAKDITPKIDAAKTIDRSKVFIVHGHDNEAKLEVARFIEKIGFDPIILHEQASGSKTIIEKIEAYSDVGFGVVIYTPCDVGAKASELNDLKGRARQNVVFEHGFLIGKLSRSNVCPLVKGNVDTPNDISGIVYTSMDTANWQLELAKELRAAGYSVDMNKVI